MRDCAARHAGRGFGTGQAAAAGSGENARRGPAPHALTLVAPDCGGGYSGATPASFRAWVDSTPYLMPDYQDVRFPSRDPAITIDAWWIPGPTADAPAVVLAHGLH